MPLIKPTLTALALGAVVVTGFSQVADASSPTAGTAATSADPGTQARTHTARVPGGPVVRRWYAGLDATDRTCLATHQVTTHPGPADAAGRLVVLEQVQSAARACDVAFPQATRLERRLQVWAGLSADQRACLAKVDLTRPVGPVTREQRQARRQALREGASACGVTLPARAGTGRHG